MGLELSRILYNAGGKIYIAGRSPDRALAAIETIKSSCTSSTPGSLHFLKLDLGDLSTVKESAREFMGKENRLDVLWNNAGISQPPRGELSAQGVDITMATNCLGPFLFTYCLLPILTSTSKSLSLASVRVVWTSSIAVDVGSPDCGIEIEHLASPPADPLKAYCDSKMGNWFLASEFGRRVKDDGILSITQNPGNLWTSILRHRQWMMYLVYPLLYDAKYGAFTELYCGLSKDLTIENTGGYVVPWGRVHPAPREALLKTLKSEEEGGTGRAALFWKWCEEKSRDFM